MTFIRKIQTKMVSASGATIGFLPLKEPRTFSSTKSTSHSTKFWAVPGTPAVAFSATRRKKLHEQPAEQDRDGDGVDVQRPEAHGADFLSVMRQDQAVMMGADGLGLVRWQVTERQIGEMVLDVSLSGERFSRRHRSSLAS